MKSAGLVVGATLVLSVMVLVPPVLVGDLNPPASPAPTMKTLDGITPTWDQVLQAAERFKLVMGGVAVLDKETGLVWERSPDTATQTWDLALSTCLFKTVGGRRGWRLPTIEELASVTDPSASSSGIVCTGNTGTCSTPPRGRDQRHPHRHGRPGLHLRRLGR